MLRYILHLIDPWNSVFLEDLLTVSLIIIIIIIIIIKIIIIIIIIIIKSYSFKILFKSLEYKFCILGVSSLTIDEKISKIPSPTNGLWNEASS